MELDICHQDLTMIMGKRLYAPTGSNVYSTLR
uniref:Uncharacterized protein n=1 Tax=Cucumis melo TaxID=3656 RepID=A0A9I9EL67_CUCME